VRRWLNRVGVKTLFIESFNGKLPKLNMGVKSGERLLIATGVSTSFGQAYELGIQWAQNSKKDEASSLRVDMGNPELKLYQYLLML